MNRIDRNKILVRHIVSSGLATSQKDLGLKLGYSSESAFSQVINEKVDYPKDFIERLQRIIPALNVDWLLTGEGEMIVDATEVVEVEEAKEMGRQEALNGHSHCAVKPDAICPRGDVARRIPFVSKEIASSPNYDIRKLVREGSPLLDLFPLFKMINGVDYVQTVITMAMAPRYMPGDYLFISFDEGQVHSGKLYLVDTKTYGTVLRHVYKDNVKGGYRLTARNPEFADVFVTFEDVYSVNSVLLHVNTNTSLTSEVNLAEEVRKRDQQINELASSHRELITAQAQVLQNQAELIAEIRDSRKRNDALIDKIINDKQI